MYQLSVLLPTKYPEKRERFIQNLKKTVSNFDSIELVMCLDGDAPTHRDKNIVTCYSPPSKFRSTFHEKPWLESTGRWMMMANDDMEFNTLNWDQMIPYDKFPDDLGMFHFRDSHFNENFACHPVFSRRVMRLEPGILSPLYQITKCDNTIWDIHPPNRRMYLDDIEIVHHHEGYGLEWKSAYEEDNAEYLKHVAFRAKIRSKIQELAGEDTAKIMLGVITAEYARRADFYDHHSMIEKPKDSICITVHGQSIANNRNRIVEQALVYGATHIMFLDDDVITRPDIIYQLLRHDKDIVMGLQLRRNFPHYPLVFDKCLDNNMFRIYELKDNETGLIKVIGGGLGCSLIRTDVFKKLEKPWFRLGELAPDQMNEDTGFYLRAQQAGYEIFCDLNCPVGHVASMVVRPARINGMWIINLDSNSDGSVNIPVNAIPQQNNIAKLQEIGSGLITR